MKQYVLRVTKTEEDGLTVEALNDGFTSLELLGIYTLKIEDIKQQTKGKIKPDVIKRTVVKDEANKDEV